jgi:uncharacterized protein (DUF983 family)
MTDYRPGTTIHGSAPSWLDCLRRGFCRRCPRCGEGRLFSGYLSVPESCGRCRLAFEPIRADDAPAYFTIFLVGHIVVPGLLMMEQWYAPPTWVQLSIWLPATLILTLGLLPYIKGAVMAAIWSSKATG